MDLTITGNVNHQKAVCKTSVTIVPQVNKKRNELMRFCNTPGTRQKMQDFMKLKDKKNFVKNYIQPMIRLGIIEMTNPDKPTGKNQRKSAQTLRLGGFFVFFHS